MKTFRLFIVVLVALGLFAPRQPAASPPTAPATPTAAPQQQATLAPKPTPAPQSTLPDLGGKDVTVAIEDAYIPFTYSR